MINRYIRVYHVKLTTQHDRDRPSLTEHAVPAQLAWPTARMVRRGRYHTERVGGSAIIIMHSITRRPKPRPLRQQNHPDFSRETLKNMGRPGYEARRVDLQHSKRTFKQENWYHKQEQEFNCHGGQYSGLQFRSKIPCA